MAKDYSAFFKEIEIRLATSDQRIFSMPIDASKYQDELKPNIESFNLYLSRWNERLIQEENNTAFLEELTDSILWEKEFDSSGTVMTSFSSSKSLWELLGYPDIGSHGMESWFDLIVFDEQDLVRKRVNEALKYEDGYDIEYHMNKADGEQILFRTVTKIYRREDGTVKKLKGITMDIDRDRIARIAGINSVSKDVDIAKKNGVINTISKMYFAVYHYNLESDSYYAIKTPDDFKKFIERSSLSGDRDYFVDSICNEEYRDKLYAFMDPDNLEERLKNKEYISCDFKTPDRGWCRAIWDPYGVDEYGNIVEALFIVQSIDEEKTLEIEQQEKIKKAMLEAQKANKVKSEFISSMSHDMRTPMNGIVGLTRIGLTKVDDKDAMIDVLTKISLASDQLLALINDVLDISKISEQKVDLVNAPFNIFGVIDENKKLFLDEITEKQIHCSCSTDDIKYPVLIGSKEHFNKILHNIMSNAIRFNRKDGGVTFIAKQDMIDDSHCMMNFTIIDSGIGISKEFLPHIFEPFTQENCGARTTFKGTGLGLAFVKRLVEVMNGTIEVSSTKGTGTTVKLSIPFEVSKEKPKCDEKITEEYSLDKLNILLVEDNSLNAEIANELLLERGAKVEIAENGKIALDKFMGNDEYYYDCILMDIRMPVLNGFDATKIIRSLSRKDSKSIPIFALTADTFTEDIIKMKEFGMNEHFAKPIDIEFVVKTISSYCKEYN